MSCGGLNGRFGIGVVVVVELDGGLFAGGGCELCVCCGGTRLSLGGGEVVVEVELADDGARVLRFDGGAVLVTCLLTFVHNRPWKVVKFGSDIYDMERWNC